MLNWQVNAQDDHYLYEVDRDLFGRGSAESVFARHFGARLLEDDCLHFVIGTDSGLLPRYVAAQLPKDSKARYIFIELDEVLEAMGERGSIAHECICVCSLAEFSEVRETATFANYYFRERLRTSVSCGAEQDFVGGYAALREAFEISQTKYGQEVGLSAYLRIFLEKQILNAPEYQRSATELFPLLRGRDVLVVAAGPSLDRHIEWVKRYRSCFVIIAVARVVGMLAIKGIRPDFVTVVDPHPPMLTVARDALARSKGIPLIASYHSHPAIVANWQEEVFFCGPRLAWESELNIPSPSTAGPTVTHFSISFAIEAGAHAIYIAGMDLCFGVEGFGSHCSNTSEAKAGPALGQIGVQQVRTYAGDLADADVHLLISADTAAALGRSAALLGIPVFNLSSSAARVEGIDYVDPATLDLRPERGSISVEEGAAPTPASGVADYLKALSSELQVIDSSLKRLTHELTKRKALIPDLFDARGVIRPKVSRKLSRIDDLVADEGRGLDAFLKTWGASTFLTDLSGKREDEITPEDLKAFYTRYYDAYLDAIAGVVEFIEQAQKKCLRRQAELDPARLLELADEWGAENEPLRIRKPFISAIHESAPDYASVVQRMNARFDRMYADLTQADEQRCRNAINTQNVLKRAYYLHERKRRDALGELARFVAEAENENLDPELKHLLYGLCAEIDEDLDLAMESYHQLIASAGGRLLELGLLQLLVVAKRREDYLLSLQVLECLEGLSKSYLKYHAEVLLTLGRVRDALDKLADYHELFPEDVDNLLRIAEVYVANGYAEQAAPILEALEASHATHPRVRRLVSMMKR